ncbi:MAG: transcription-repair coupling factor [Solobacterium sp.]|nr:transcription-repair coupling factor [Solobacterium sp.]
MLENEGVKILNVERGTLPLTSVIEEALIISASYRKRPRPILVIKKNLYNAQRLYERISGFLDNDECALFGADESLRVEAIATSPEMTAMKTETLSSLLERPNQVVVTCPSAYLRHLPSPEVFRSVCISLHTGDEITMDELKQKLVIGGYQQTSHIDQPLCFAARGGIVDIYSINYDRPVRIEFFDTEIESIRFFDIATQKTVETVQDVRIVPASELLFTDEDVQEIRSKTEELLKERKTAMSGEIETDLMTLESHIAERRLYPYTALLSHSNGIEDYMDHPLIIISDEEAVQESVHKLIQDTTEYISEMSQEGKMIPKYAVYRTYDRCGQGCRKIKEDPFEDNITGIEEVHLPNEVLGVKLRMIHRAEPVILAVTEKETERILDACIEERIPYSLLTYGGTPVSGINVTILPLAQGFAIPDEHLTVYSSAELFAVHLHKGRYENKFRSAEVIHSYHELEPGDYIVHAQYGVGQYIGIETRLIQNIRRDYLKIAYRGNAELYVPLEQFRMVRKFISREGVVPRLNKLGSGDWEKTKQKLKKNVDDIADRLIRLYASREENIGFAFSPDTEMTYKFERDFEFELTPDQEQAVKDIKKDMESPKPMDRLVCGDVGFGKTEVAVRASFKAVCDRKQVAVLCPTTILAEQHFRTFSKRYENYPVKIRVLDRFVPAAEVKQTLKDLRAGQVDILIGTHRILSKDVQFKNLGLLVVDEEQRFGVEHKEKIKEMKNGIDVLALSATPIPRTLQMSLVGIRQLSTLDTPPLNRYSVQTYVVEKNRNLIIDAIQKELARDGQVFYLYNNIERIYNVARGLQEAIPDARISIVHGQLDREMIETIMMKFTRHEIDILVCTTIIENGIDIPNVNTIFIDNAQDFGLAQIYQIKGRVGRSSRLGYAYLLIPPSRQLSEVAQKRLQAVKEFAALGSGYKVAMRDLTIRGAGDLLGEEQSGFIDTVGIDMYIEMLEEAIAERKDPGREKPAERAVVNIQKTSYIPEKFAPDDFDKLSMYQEIDKIENEADLARFRKDILDQYGQFPPEVEALFDKKKLEIMINSPEVRTYREVNGKPEITFTKEFSEHVDGVDLFFRFNKISKSLKYRYTGGCIIVSIPKVKNDLEMSVAVIQAAKEAKRV